MAMTQEDKRRVVIVVGIIIIAAILLMLGGRDRSPTVVNRSGDIPASNNSFGDIFVSRQPFTIPDLGVIRASESLNAIGACCADCRPSSNQPRSYEAMPRTTIVFNEGDRGPNIYNYYAPPPPPYMGTITMRTRV